MKALLTTGLLTFFGVMLPVKGSCAQAPDTIYFGGPIYTMVHDGDRVEALAVANGMIVAIGAKDDILKTKGPDTTLIDLGGKCLLPGFIDPHSHVVQQALKFSVVNLDPYPIGDVKTIADVQRKLRERIEKTKPEKGKWVFGWGYDDTGLVEMRHPTRDDLDNVSTDHPIALMHISNHLMTCNSKALELAGITAETKDPDGGKIQRKPGSSEPNGVLEELGLLILLSKIPAPSADRAMEMLTYGIAKYAEAGITTAQDGASTPGMLKLLEKANEAGKLPIDIVVYPLYKVADEAMVADIAQSWRNFGRYRIGGIKLAIDGSIQGYTAYLSKPYHVQPSGSGDLEADRCESDAGTQMVLGVDAVSDEREHNHDNDKPTIERGYRGYANMTPDEVVSWVRTCDDAGIQCLAHCNGDAAIDMLIDAIRSVRTDRPRSDLRTVIIHAQTMREDQLNFAANQGLVPSFFPIHVTFWGDRHRDIFLGPDRAARISPSRSALDRGMKITLHHDAPVAGIDMLAVVSAAVNRSTTSGKLLGPEQAITPYEAFRTITKDAAWQYFEEHRKGTLENGKLADFVIIDKDPFSIDPKKIVSIQIAETIKEGKTVFKRD
jgi:predicted amidohydrolase YtcJ